MATKTRPQRPARTIVESPSAVEEMRAPDAAVESLPPVSLSPPHPIAPSDFRSVLESENGEPTGATIFIPLAEIPTEGNVRRSTFTNIDCRLSEKGHVESFQKLYYCLNQTHTQLACGKHIDTPSDVIKYLLEQFTLVLSGS